jgi:hypothetical protein
LVGGAEKNLERMALPIGGDELVRLIAEGAYRPALEALVQSCQHLIIHHRIAMLGAAA